MHIGIIGAGVQARIHAAAVAAVDGVELATVAGRTAANVEAVAGEFGARPIDSPDELIQDPAIDAVVLACPTAQHHAYALAAFDAGKHVFTEVPIALTVAEADAMIAAAQRAGRVLMAGHILCFVATVARFREIVASGELGDVVAVSSARYSPPYWREGETLASGHHGDVVKELLAFDIDVFNWMFGQPDDIRGHGHKTGGAFDHVQVALRYGDVVIAAEASALMPRGASFTTTLRAICRDGVVELDVSLPENAPVEWRFETVGPGGERTAVETDPVDPNAAMIEAFRRAVEDLPISGVATAEAARDTLNVCRRVDQALHAADMAFDL